MPSISTDIEPGVAPSGIWVKTVTLFKRDTPYLKLMCGLLFVWFCLAQISMLIYPDTVTEFTESNYKYLQYALRNGQFYLKFFGLFLLIKLFLALKNESIRSYIQNGYRRDSKPFYGIPVMFLFSLIAFAIFLYTYSTIKTRIPNMVPFAWDEAFYKLDKLIFLGKDPWQYFAFIYDYPKVVAALDFIYDFWAVIMMGTWIFVLQYRQSGHKRRYQFIIALLLTWFIGGNVLASLMSSAGPVYYENVTGLVSPYAEQIAHLTAVNAEYPLRAFEYQATLWYIYESPTIGLGGISAMPSMHCASAFLLVLMFGKNPYLRTAFIGFFVLILITSFVLAWHYAVDGLLAIPISYGCWKLAGWLVKKVTPEEEKLGE